MGKRLRLGRRAVPEILVAEIVGQDEEHVRLGRGGSGGSEVWEHRAIVVLAVNSERGEV